MERYSPYLYARMRVVIGFLFACHGAQKVFSVLGGLGGEGAPVPLFSLLWFAGVIELAAGSLLVVGLLTKYAAFIASGEMAFAYFMVHVRKGPWPILNGGELAVVYCFILLFIAARGAYICSLDTLLERSKFVDEAQRIGDRISI